MKNQVTQNWRVSIINNLQTTIEGLRRYLLMPVVYLTTWSLHRVQTSQDTPKLSYNSIHTVPVWRSKSNLMRSINRRVPSQFTTLCTMPGRWSLSPRTVWKTSTTFSVFSCSNRMLTVMNVPVLPQPPLHIQTHKAVRVSNTQGSMCIKHTRQYVYQHTRQCQYSLLPLNTVLEKQMNKPC